MARFTRSLKLVIPGIVLAGAAITAALPIGRRYSVVAADMTWGALKDPFTRTALEKKIEEEFGLQIIGDKSDERLGILDAHLHQVKSANPALLKNVRTLYVHPHAMTGITGLNGYANAITRSSIGMTVDGLPKLAHEIAHLYHFNLPAKSEFDEKWRALAGGAHATTALLDDDCPREGCARWYGTKNIREDICTLVEEAYMVPTRLRHADPSDLRYARKLDLLRDYGFISPAQCEHLCEQLGKEYKRKE